MLNHEGSAYLAARMYDSSLQLHCSARDPTMQKCRDVAAARGRVDLKCPLERCDAHRAPEANGGSVAEMKRDILIAT